MSLPSALALYLENGPLSFLSNGTWEMVPPGFSGAVVYHGTASKSIPLADILLRPSTRPSDRPLALKGWPHRVSLERVQEVHTYQSSLGDIPFVPKLHSLGKPDLGRLTEATAVFAGDRVWELSDWMAGEPVREKAYPPPLRRAAVDSLRQVHARWNERFGSRKAPCPAVIRRLELLDDFRKEWPRGDLPIVDPILTTATIRVPGLIERAYQTLAPWATQRVTVHPCFTDLHRDHVLFQNGQLSGIIDYGAVKPDSPAADLARLFGESTETLSVALAEYGDVPEQLAHDLAATAPVCNLAAWIVRIERDREPIADRDAVAQRIADWVERLG